MKILINQIICTTLLAATIFSCTKEKIQFLSKSTNVEPVSEKNYTTNGTSYSLLKTTDTPYIGIIKNDTPYYNSKVSDTPYVDSKLLDTPYIKK